MESGSRGREEERRRERELGEQIRGGETAGSKRKNKNYIYLKIK